MLLKKSNEVKDLAHEKMSSVTMVDESGKTKIKNGDSVKKNGNHLDVSRSEGQSFRRSKNLPRNKSIESLRNKLDIARTDSTLQELLANPNRK